MSPCHSQKRSWDTWVLWLLQFCREMDEIVTVSTVLIDLGILSTARKLNPVLWQEPSEWSARAAVKQVMVALSYSHAAIWTIILIIVVGIIWICFSYQLCIGPWRISFDSFENCNECFFNRIEIFLFYMKMSLVLEMKSWSSDYSMNHPAVARDLLL